MAYIQEITPPPNKVMTFSLKDFSGGMNNRSDQISDNEGSEVINLMFSDDTVLETRYGQKYYSDVEYDSEVIFIDEYKPLKEENQLIVGTSTTLYIGDKTTPLNGIPTGVNYLGNYYFTDGESLKVYGKLVDEKGTYVKVEGTKIDDYEFYDIVSPSDGHEQLDTSHKQGVKVIDYTNKKVYYEPCKNEFEDEYKGANKVPEIVKYILSKDGRLFVSGHNKDDDNVFITDVENPLYFPVTLLMQIPPDSNKIIGMHIFDDSVIVGREYDIYTITGKTNNPNTGHTIFELKKLNTHTGFASHQAVDIAHNYLIFLGTDGNVYAIQNARTYERELATIILSRTIDLNKKPINISKDDYSSAVSYFANDEWYLGIKDKVLVYSYRHMSWVMYTNLDANCFYKLDSEWVWGKSNGRIAMWDKENFFDFGEPYQSLWYSKSFDMDDANSFKQFREFFLVAHTFGSQYSDIYVTFEVDYANIKDRVVISNQVARWGFSKFGDRFVNKNINESLPFIIGRRGRNIRIKITNSYPLDGSVATYSDLENYPEKRDNKLVKILDTNEYYLYLNYEWNLIEKEALNQRMKVYQVNGDYEMRGKR